MTDYHALQRDAMCMRRMAIKDFLGLVAQDINVYDYERVRRRIYDLEAAIDRGDAATFECVAAQIASTFADMLGLDAYTELRALADEIQTACFAGFLGHANQLQEVFDAVLHEVKP